MAKEPFPCHAIFETQSPDEQKVSDAGKGSTKSKQFIANNLTLLLSPATVAR
jgi:hypothetical protein